MDHGFSCEDIARQSCQMVPRWRYFCVLYFQRVVCSTFHTCMLNSHWGHTMCVSIVDSQSAMTEIRWGRKGKKKKQDETRIWKKKPQDGNIMSASVTQGDHNKSNFIRWEVVQLQLRMLKMTYCWKWLLNFSRFSSYILNLTWTNLWPSGGNYHTFLFKNYSVYKNIEIGSFLLNYSGNNSVVSLLGRIAVLHT